LVQPHHRHQACHLPPKAGDHMELVVLAYNAVTELCDAQGDSQKT